MKKIIVILFYFFLHPVYSQITLLESYPFQAGEKVVYDAIYDWGFITLKAGVVTFYIDSLQKDGEAYYLLHSTGISKPNYDWLYMVRDSFQSTVKVSDFQPIHYKRNTNEGKYQVNNEIFFKEEEGIIQMELDNTEDGYRITSLPYENDVFDLQTAVYFARLLDPASARMGNIYHFHIIIDGEPYTIPIRYEGKEILHLSNGNSYSCHRISTEVIEGTIFRSQETIKIWVTDDGSQIPIKVEAPIIVGKVIAELTEYSSGK